MSSGIFAETVYFFGKCSFFRTNSSGIVKKEIESCRMANRADVDRAFVFSIDVKNGVDLVVVKGADLAGAEAEANCCQSKVLRYVACIEIDVAVGSLAVLEFRTLEYGREDKYSGSGGTDGLSESGFSDPAAIIGCFELLEMVVYYGIVIEARLEVFDAVGDDVSLDGIKRSGRWGGTEFIAGFGALDAGSGPEKIRELGHGDWRFVEGADALSGA